MPSLFDQMAGPHGSAVIAGDTGVATGRVWSESREKKELAITIVGRTLDIYRQANPSAEDSGFFDRQRLALGDAGQEALRNLHVGSSAWAGRGLLRFCSLCIWASVVLR